MNKKTILLSILRLAPLFIFMGILFYNSKSFDQILEQERAKTFDSVSACANLGQELCPVEMDDLTSLKLVNEYNDLFQTNYIYDQSRKALIPSRHKFVGEKPSPLEETCNFPIRSSELITLFVLAIGLSFVSRFVKDNL